MKCQTRDLPSGSTLKSQIRTGCCIMLALVVCGCATTNVETAEEWAAYGFMSAAQSDEGTLIGVYSTKADCRLGTEEWLSRQVVGNPISAACYPVDKH